MSDTEKISSILKRLDHLEAAVFGSGSKSNAKKSATSEQVAPPSKLDFNLNERNFIKTHAKGLSGSKKFTLLLAFMAKGKTDQNIETNAIKSKWNKMTAANLMGYEFNPKYPSEAKTSGWVDSKAHGTYHLRNNWTEIFK